MPLLPVQDVVVTVASGGRDEVPDVGARTLLGDRVALLLLAAHGRQQPGLALVVVGHVGPPRRGRGQAPGDAVGDPAALLLDQHLLEVGAPRSADRGRHVGGVQPELDRPFVVGLRHLVGEPPVVLLGGLLEADQLVGELARAPLEIEVLRGQAVHGSSASGSLTDCSVYARLAGVTSGSPRTADAVIVGGGTVGAWCAWFLREAGLADVVLLEQRTLGAGASPRAAGMVRAQGGTEAAVRLGLFSRDFYSSQHERLGIDSGFVAQGYFMPCFSDREVAEAEARIAMQQGLGLDVRWVGPDELDGMNPAMADGRTMGGSYAPGDGYIDPPRNVLAYTAALFTSGVQRGRAHRVHRAAPRGRPGHRRRHVRRRDRHRAGRAHRRADPGRGRPGGRRTHPGRRCPAPGRRHPGRIPTSPPTGCRWSSTSRPASTGGPRRAACSGG